MENEAKGPGTLASQIKSLDLGGCPQSIVRIDGNIVLVTGDDERKRKTRIVNVANGATIKGVHVIRKDRVLFTFDGCPNIEVGIHKNEPSRAKVASSQASRGVTLHLQTRGSRFVYQEFFEDCSVLVQDQTITDTGEISDRQASSVQ